MMNPINNDYWVIANFYFSRLLWRDFKPQQLLPVGGFEIQLFVKMQYPRVLHFHKQLYFEASQK